jgi:acetyltransferase
VLLFGTGGTLVEVFKDRELALPPLNSTLARRMMERTKIYHALQGIRGRDPVDMAELEQVLVRFSQLVVEQKWIKEIEINPLLASPEQIIALDARVVLYDADTQLADVPRLAIRPYPTRYTHPWLLHDGTPVNIRPIRPEDEPKIADFHGRLSSESVYMRYFSSLDLDTRTAHSRLTRICFIDYDREMALVITRKNPKTEEREIIAVGRMTKIRGKDEAEFALLIRDDHQRQGIGTVLLQRLLVWAKDEKVGCVVAYILPANAGMKRICQKLGFSFQFEDGAIKAEILLDSAKGD